jgi:alpha-L-arabinofuranosidase
MRDLGIMGARSQRRRHLCPQLDSLCCGNAKSRSDHKADCGRATTTWIGIELFVSNAGSVIDYLAIHHYYGRREMQGETANLMSHPLFYQRFYAQVATLLKEVSPRHEIKLFHQRMGSGFITQQQYSMLSALYGARLMNVFERTNGLVAMSAVSDLVNGWPGGIIQASREGSFVSPIYLVNQLYANAPGREILTSVVESPTLIAAEKEAGTISLMLSLVAQKMASEYLSKQ